MTSFVKLVLLICAATCCNQPLVTGSPLAASTGNKIRDSEPLKPLVFCEKFVMDMGILIPEGGNYTHGCDIYECRNGHLIEDIHQCENTLSDWDRDLCIQWSDDGCCCDVIGCMDINGEVKEVGQMYMKEPSSDPDRPECALRCQCQSGPLTCMANRECNEVAPL